MLQGLERNEKKARPLGSRGHLAGHSWGIATARGHEAICIKVPLGGIGINGLEVCTGSFDL